MPKIAIVAALERELAPLVKSWRVQHHEWDGRQYKLFENEQAVAICGGIGPRAGRRACEAVVALYRPERVISAGFAGALRSGLRVGSILRPAAVIDVSDGSRCRIPGGTGVLVSAQEVVGADQKKKLGEAYSADAVDMEAAAVWKAAEARGVNFAAVKAISDEAGFDIPVTSGAIDCEGRFHTGRFVAFAAVRPWLWGRVVQLARNSSRGTRSLCVELERMLKELSAS